MYTHPWSRTLITATVLFCGLAGCEKENDTPAQLPQQPSYRIGWSHNCWLTCTNVSVNQPEKVERPGRLGNGIICMESKQDCEAERATACINAVAATNNETLYDNCELLSEGECTESCTLPQ